MGSRTIRTSIRPYVVFYFSLHTRCASIDYTCICVFVPLAHSVLRCQRGMCWIEQYYIHAYTYKSLVSLSEKNKSYIKSFTNVLIYGCKILRIPLPTSWYLFDRSIIYIISCVITSHASIFYSLLAHCLPIVVLLALSRHAGAEETPCLITISTCWVATCGHLQRVDTFRTLKSGHERPFVSPRGYILFARPFASGCAPTGGGPL
jgi:hypothetical protein